MRCAWYKELFNVSDSSMLCLGVPLTRECGGECSGVTLSDAVSKSSSLNPGVCSRPSNLPRLGPSLSAGDGRTAAIILKILARTSLCLDRFPLTGRDLLLLHSSKPYSDGCMARTLLTIIFLPIWIINQHLAIPGPEFASTCL
jgi:hypothetical protein